MVDKFEEKSNYTTKNVLYLFNHVIYEYDIHSADVNICKRYNLLPEDKIKKLESMDKKRRVVAVGKLQRDKDFRDSLLSGFCRIRREFYDSNDLEKEDIISVKKDAIFTTKKCKKLHFGNLEFVPKNIYTSFIQFGGLEVYFHGDDVDVKGIDDRVLKKHENGILKVIITFFRKMETSSKSEVLSYMNRIVSRYKRRELPLDYYRRFNRDSKYHVVYSDDMFDEYWDDKVCDIDINYNFFNVLIPLIKIAL